jgi:hypothetical protein
LKLVLKLFKDEQKMSRKKYEIGQVINGVKIKRELKPNLYKDSKQGIKPNRKLLLEYPDGHEEIVLVPDLKKKIFAAPQKRGRPKKQPPKYNKLTFLRFATPYKSPHGVIKKQALFQCDCGEMTIKIFDYVISGHTKSCGCDRTGRPKKDLIGQRMGTYYIFEEIDRDTEGKSTSNKSHSRLFLCECDQGGEHKLTMARLRALKNNRVCPICNQTKD